MVLCSHVIEATTTEHTWQPMPDEGTRYQVVRLQKSCTVSDQQFDSYAIFHSENDPRIRSSRLNKANYNFLAAVGTAPAVGGFIVQFVGLRALLAIDRHAARCDPRADCSTSMGSQRACEGRNSLRYPQWLRDVVARHAHLRPEVMGDTDWCLRSE